MKSDFASVLRVTKMVADLVCCPYFATLSGGEGRCRGATPGPR